MIKEKSRCPECKTPAYLSHCKSPSCVWDRCTCKTTRLKKVFLIFDEKGRSFEIKAD